MGWKWAGKEPRTEFRSPFHCPQEAESRLHYFLKCNPAKPWKRGNYVSCYELFELDSYPGNFSCATKGNFEKHFKDKNKVGSSVAQGFSDAFGPGCDPGDPGSGPRVGLPAWSLLLPLPVLPLCLSLSLSLWISK